MTAETPLDRLRDAVEAFLADTSGEGTLAGFVLLAQTTVLDGDARPELMPVAAGQHYATDLAAPTAAGLAHGFARLIDGIVAGSMHANGIDV